MRNFTGKARDLFEAAEEASSTGLYKSGKPRQIAVHEWLSAEVLFANEVGFDFVTEPTAAPQEEWQCQIFHAVAATLQTIRHQYSGEVARAAA